MTHCILYMGTNIHIYIDNKLAGIKIIKIIAITCPVKSCK